MSENFINQITLNCLLNNDILNKHLVNQKAKKLNKKEKKFYRKRIYNLFKQMILGNIKEEEINPDIRYAYDNFINASIQYFKTVDNNDLIQSDYKDIEEHKEDLFNDDFCENNDDIQELNYSYAEADNLLIRTVKIEPPTLDRYVKKTTYKKKDEIIFPKQKNINLKDPELKNKGLKKKNIDNLYEDCNEKEQNEKVI
jgi:hypothetical protein